MNLPSASFVGGDKCNAATVIKTRPSVRASDSTNTAATNIAPAAHGARRGDVSGVPGRNDIRGSNICKTGIFCWRACFIPTRIPTFDYLGVLRRCSVRRVRLASSATMRHDTSA